jgi:pilus assembly protein Flp/PilA
MLERINVWALRLYGRVQSFDLEREEGQALVEYALILALIAVFAIAALKALGGSVSNVLQQISNSISGA